MCHQFCKKKKRRCAPPTLRDVWGQTRYLNPSDFQFLNIARARFFTEKELLFHLTSKNHSQIHNISSVNLYTFSCEHIEQMKDEPWCVCVCSVKRTFFRRPPTFSDPQLTWTLASPRAVPVPCSTPATSKHPKPC